MPTSARAAFPGENGQIVFTRQSTLDSGVAALYTMEPDGSGQTNRSGPLGADTSGSFSPDGTKIAFDRLREGNFGVYIMNADGSNQTRLTDPVTTNSDPAFSPDGRRIAFVSGRDNNDSEIYVMNVDGSDQRRLTNSPGFDGSPVFSPDGTKIAFKRGSGDSNSELHIMNADGSGQTRLTNEAKLYYFNISFSPDGHKIAFSSARLDPSTSSGSNPDIYVVNADGSGEVRLTTAAGEDSRPAFSPDGTKIAFTSYRGGHAEIHTMNTDGTGVTQLTERVPPLNSTSAFPDWGVRPGTGRGLGRRPARGADPGPPGQSSPAVLGGCVNFQSAIGGRRLGLARLGGTRAGHRRLFKGARLRRRPGLDRYCITGGGSLSIGYPTRRLSRGLGPTLRRWIKSRALVLLTTSPRYSLRDVNPGSSVAIMRRYIRGERRYRVGRNVWYLAPGRTSRLIFKTRARRVLAIGLADKRLASSRSAAKRLLGAWRL